MKNLVLVLAIFGLSACGPERASDKPFTETQNMVTQMTYIVNSCVQQVTLEMHTFAGTPKEARHYICNDSRVNRPCNAWIVNTAFHYGYAPALNDVDDECVPSHRP